LCSGQAAVASLYSCYERDKTFSTWTIEATSWAIHHRREERTVSTTVTEEQIRDLVATGKPFSVALLWWGPNRHMDGAAAIEFQHQQRMVSLRADGTIAVLCPAQSETLAGVAVMTGPHEDARTIMSEDPCVKAGMMNCDVYPVLGFPGDALPGQ
jgi:hypothetical protein